MIKKSAAPTAALMAALAMGCSPGEEVPAREAGAETAAAAATEAPPALGDACDLIPLEDVEALAGKDLQATPISPDEVGRANANGCSYETVGSGLAIPSVLTTVYWTNGVDEWDASVRGYGLAERTIGRSPDADGFDPAAELESVMVEVGDRAIYRNHMPSHVLVGDVLVEMSFPALAADARMFALLAEKAVSRLEP
ncbi:MAG TPA: DUF3558 family protein [Longimicrobiales bacterium]|nr:DUF3558 family protein [Longimicrobiales bacterium]